MVSFVKGNLVKIKNLKAGDIFEMDGNKYVITRSGHGYADVEFKLKNKGKDTLTTSNKNLVVRFVKESL